jgi:hypothetical protein
MYNQEKIFLKNLLRRTSMKKQFLALCLAGLAFTAMHGTIYAGPKHKKNKCSSSSSHSHKPCRAALANASAAASGVENVFPLTSDYQPVPFAPFAQIDGKGIEAVSDTDFQLDKGRYLVTYSNTELALSGPGNVVYLDYAIYLGGFQIFEFTDSAEIDFDNTKLKSFSVIVTAVRPSPLNIQVRLDPVDTTGFDVALGNRTISIVKLS